MLDPSTAMVVTTAVGLGTRLIACAAYVLTLRWRARAEEDHRRYVAAVVRVLPPGSRLIDARPDGGKLHVTLPDVGNQAEGSSTR
ncbi:hypothetical protein [Streptomyces violascens]|uniref:hypothetical protein n=1 Tax=Streptomyces violascens TaxID=67381 RepID=UPI0036AE1155